MKAFTLFSFIVAVSFAYGQWTDITPPSSNGLGKLSFPTDQVGYIVEPSSNNIYKTTDGGSNWTTVQVDSVADLADVHFVTPQVGYAVSNPAFAINKWTIAKTVDGGNTWTRIAPDVQAFNNVYFKDQNNGFASARFGNIYYTSDGGASWNQVIPQTYYEFANLSVTGNGDTIQIGGWDGTFAYAGVLARSTDGGQTWSSNIIPRTYSHVNAVNLVNASVGFYTEGLWGNASGGYLYRTTDGFATVDSVLQPATNIHDIHFSDVNNGILVGDSGAIYTTSNGGQSYTKEYQHSAIQSLRHIETTSTKMYVSGDNVLLRKDGLSGIENPDSQVEFSVYPNPTTNNVTLNVNKQVSVQLMNAIGQPVWSQEVSEGSHLLIFPKLSNGTYLLRVGRVTQRLLIIK